MCGGEAIQTSIGKSVFTIRVVKLEFSTSEGSSGIYNDSTQNLTKYLSNDKLRVVNN